MDTFESTDLFFISVDALEKFHNSIFLSLHLPAHTGGTSQNSNNFSFLSIQWPANTVVHYEIFHFCPNIGQLTQLVHHKTKSILHFIHTLVSSYKWNITKLTQFSISIHILASSHCSVHYMKRTLTSISVYALVSSHILVHSKTQTICHLCP